MISKKKYIVPLVALICFFCIFWRAYERYPDSDWSEINRSRREVYQMKQPVITFQRIPHLFDENSHRSWDATEELLYIHCEANDSIEVYTHDGEYLYAILIPNEGKGGSSNIRCVGNQLYLLDPRGNVYVFQGQEMEKQIDYKTAYNSGYTYEWCDNKKQYQMTEGSTLYQLDEKGIVTDKIVWPSEPPESVNIWRTAIFFGSIFLGLFYYLKS